VSAPRPLRILFFALLAVSEGYYSARRGPSLFGVAEAIMGLFCAVIAWEQCVEGWRGYKARRVARMLAEMERDGKAYSEAYWAAVDEWVARGWKGDGK
jgi:hypothetical protein